MKENRLDFQDDDFAPQQRQLIQDFLAEGERSVSSTQPRIRAILRQEIQEQEDIQRAATLPQVPAMARRLPNRARLHTRNLLAVLAVAAIIFASFGIFGLFSKLHPQSNTNASSIQQPSSVPSSASSSNLAGGWNQAIIAIEHPGTQPTLTIQNYDPLSGNYATLVKQPPYLPPDTRIDGVSPQGDNLLYQFALNGHEFYHTLNPLASTGFFYELSSDNAGNALWMPDSLHVLIATNNTGLLKVDTTTGKANTLFPALSGVKLTFVSQDYLYFVGAGDPNYSPAGLYRINLSSAAVQTVSSLHTTNAVYWFSPDGSTVYFANSIGPAGGPWLYAVNTDGSNLHVLRQYTDAHPVGFAANNALEIVMKVQGRFALIQLGATQQQDHILVADIAPGASSLCSSTTAAGQPDICESNLALSPYAYSLLVFGINADGTTTLWINDLVTNKQNVLLSFDNNTQVVLPGWDRLAVPSN